MSIMLLSKKDDLSAKILCKELGFTHNKLTPPTKIIINYGLDREQKRVWELKNAKYVKHIPIINDFIHMSDYDVVKIAESIGIPTPETHRTLPVNLNIKQYSDFLIKHNYDNDNSNMQKLTPTNLPQKNTYIQKHILGSSQKIDVFLSLWSNRVKVTQKNSDEKRGINVRSPTSSNVFRGAIAHSFRLVRHLPNMSFGVVSFLYTKHNMSLNLIKAKPCLTFTPATKSFFVGLFTVLLSRIDSKRNLAQYVQTISGKNYYK